MGLSAAELVARAEAVAARGHAPHSGFRVGAVAEDAGGGLHPGVNVESDSYGLSLCAERAAIARAVADGALAGGIVAVGVGRADGGPVTPCGACRQVLADLAPAARVAVRGAGGAVVVHTVAELLPGAFSLEDR